MKDVFFTKTNGNCKRIVVRLLIVFALLTTTFAHVAFSQDSSKTNDDMLDQYVGSKGDGIIVFDSTNIKQFLTTNSVISINKSVEIMLKPGKDKSNISDQLPFQLANVSEDQDCIIEVISDTPDVGISVLGNKNMTISQPSTTDHFINYTVSSTSFHLEDTNKMSFAIILDSQKADSLQIKKMIFSFARNKNSSFMRSPGVLSFSKDNTIVEKGKMLDESSDQLVFSEKNSKISSSKKIYVFDNSISSSATIKNIGDTPTHVYIGFKSYTKDNITIDRRFFPLVPENKILTVLSATKGSDTIVVDGESDWKKGSAIAINAKEDLSDLPNSNVLKETILDVKKNENGNVEITLNKPLSIDLDKNTKVRIHGTSKSAIYTSHKVIEPGAEETFTSTIQKDDNNIQFSSSSFSRGTYYVVPFIYSNSEDPEKENTIQVQKYTLEF